MSQKKPAALRNDRSEQHGCVTLTGGLVEPNEPSKQAGRSNSIQQLFITLSLFKSPVADCHVVAFNSRL